MYQQCSWLCKGSEREKRERERERDSYHDFNTVKLTYWVGLEKEMEANLAEFQIREAQEYIHKPVTDTLLRERGREGGREGRERES